MELTMTSVPQVKRKTRQQKIWEEMVDEDYSREGFTRVMVLALVIGLIWFLPLLLFLAQTLATR
jgi:hypothetical protein